MSIGSMKDRLKLMAGMQRDEVIKKAAKEETNKLHRLFSGYQTLFQGWKDTTNYDKVKKVANTGLDRINSLVDEPNLKKVLFEAKRNAEAGEFDVRPCYGYSDFGTIMDTFTNHAIGSINQIAAIAHTVYSGSDQQKGWDILKEKIGATTPWVKEVDSFLTRSSQHPEYHEKLLQTLLGTLTEKDQASVKELMLKSRIPYSNNGTDLENFILDAREDIAKKEIDADAVGKITFFRELEGYSLINFLHDIENKTFPSKMLKDADKSNKIQLLDAISKSSLSCSKKAAHLMELHNFLESFNKTDDDIRTYFLNDLPLLFEKEDDKGTVTTMFTEAIKNAGGMYERLQAYKKCKEELTSPRLDKIAKAVLGGLR